MLLTLLQSQGATPPVVVVPADTHDGVGRAGGALIHYRRPHKKVYDEIEEYFALLTETEATAVVMEAREIVGDADERAAAANSLRARAVAKVAKMMEVDRRDELRALMALAMDEDDAEAVLVMLELLH